MLERFQACASKSKVVGSRHVDANDGLTLMLIFWLKLKRQGVEIDFLVLGLSSFLCNVHPGILHTMLIELFCNGCWSCGFPLDFLLFGSWESLSRGLRCYTEPFIKLRPFVIISMPHA